MKFDNGIDRKYRQSVRAAFDAIMAHGTDLQRKIAGQIVDSNMLVRVAPVSQVNASGVTGLIDPGTTNERIADEHLSLREALGEIYIAIAEETIDTGGQRGCEGTFVHEGRHAYDFARTITSFSNADVNPLSLFDPTLYELELEGLGLMILGRDAATSPCYVSDTGIHRRLQESYGLDPNGNQGPRASELLGLRLK